MRPFEPHRDKQSHSPVSTLMVCLRFFRYWALIATAAACLVACPYPFPVFKPTDSSPNPDNLGPFQRATTCHPNCHSLILPSLIMQFYPFNPYALGATNHLFGFLTSVFFTNFPSIGRSTRDVTRILSLFLQVPS